MNRIIAVVVAAGIAVAGLGGTGWAPAQAAVAAAGDNYRISTRDGVTMPTGSTDAGVHCNGSEETDCGTYLSAPFAITAYGRTFSRMYVTGNGTVQFAGASNASSYQSCLPTTTFTGPTLLPYWNEGDTDTRDRADLGVFSRTYGSAPHRQFVVEWRELQEIGGFQDFSETFSEGSGVITTTYGTTGGHFATIGAQNAGSTASQFSCNAADGATHAGLQITYTPTTTGPQTYPPSAPPGLYARPVADQETPAAALEWDQPTSDGGSAITGYVISRDGTSDTGGGPYTSPVLPPDQLHGQLGHLVRGATYQLSVQAVNAVGRGPATVFTYTEPQQGHTPAAPRIGTATAGVPGGDITASLTWNHPPGTTTPTIYSYTVYAYRVVDGRNVEILVRDKVAYGPRTITFPLDHAGQWRFRVRASNDVGTSPFSSYSNTVAGR